MAILSRVILVKAIVVVKEVNVFSHILWLKSRSRMQYEYNQKPVIFVRKVFAMAVFSGDIKGTHFKITLARNI